MTIITRQDFIDTLPGDTQETKSWFLGISQPALCRWAKTTPTGIREDVLLMGWGLLTPEQKQSVFNTIDESYEDE
jgi:hypothetical protein